MSCSRLWGSSAETGPLISHRKRQNRTRQQGNVQHVYQQRRRKQEKTDSTSTEIVSKKMATTEEAHIPFVPPPQPAVNHFPGNTCGITSKDNSGFFRRGICMEIKKKLDEPFCLAFPRDHRANKDDAPQAGCCWYEHSPKYRPRWLTFYPLLSITTTLNSRKASGKGRERLRPKYRVSPNMRWPRVFICRPSWGRRTHRSG